MASHTNRSILTTALVACAIVAALWPAADASSSCSPGNKEIVRRMYRQALNREPDSGGLRTYCSHLQSGRTVQSLFSPIVRSSEYREKFVYDRSTFFTVVNLYKVILGRCPNKEGLLHKERVLRGNCRGNFESIVNNMFASREYGHKFGSNLVPSPKPGPNQCPTGERPDFPNGIPSELKC